MKANMIKAALLVVMATVAINEAIVCLPNYCDNVQCEAITTCDGRIISRGGFCGCCDICKKVLNPGDNCFQMLFRGVPSTVMCPDNYHCDAVTTKCIAVKQ
ncbi:saxiphilin [Biomphalaria pfeifferi]|uniref:Saxiphilin n=1 Tax=Biomphalaria pfeifferi TaxID=112525 RepID=A0AAD8C708_BIOPF|nr:saxiphilin [Biomphalaria pfeifferi]